MAPIRRCSAISATRPHHLHLWAGRAGGLIVVAIGLHSSCAATAGSRRGRLAGVGLVVWIVVDIGIEQLFAPDAILLRWAARGAVALVLAVGYWHCAAVARSGAKRYSARRDERRRSRRRSASACPHDCPSTCALEVELLDERTIGRVHGAKDNDYTPA